MTAATLNSIDSLLHVKMGRNRIARAVSAQTGTQLARIQVLVKARPAVFEKAFIDDAHGLQLIATYGAVDRKDRQDAALVTQRAVVVPVSQVPTSLDRYRSIAAKCPEIIFEVSVGGSVRAGQD